MVTPDKDYGQLVSDNIKIYKPAYQGGSPEIMGPKEICEKWDIARVDQVIDMLGLMGDAVDNIPGIKGVGEKTAAKLLKEYDTLENILDNAEKIKGSLGEKVKAGKADAIISKQLATIILDVPVTFHEEDYKLSEMNKEVLAEVFAELEFKTMGERILGKKRTDDRQPTIDNKKAVPATGQMDLFGNATETISTNSNDDEVEEIPALVVDKNINNTPHNYLLVQSDEEIENLISLLNQHTEICFDTETTHIDANQAELVGLSFSVKPTEGYYIPCTENREECIQLLNKFQILFNDSSKTWIGQNLKYDLLMLKWYGFALAGNIFDTMLAHYVIEPDGKRSMDLLSAKYLGYEPVSITSLIGKKGKGQGTMRDVAIEVAKEYAAEDADITLQLKNIFLPQLAEKTVEKVFYEVENPLVKVLTDMEFEGIKIDMEFLKSYSVELDIEAKVAEENVYELAGVRFNLASPKQLGEVLFDKMKLDPKAKKTKTGQYATGEDVLAK